MINLLDTAAPSWDDPIEMLYACHGKVKKFCNQINKLPDYLQHNGCNDIAKQAITQICTYFNRAAPLHHEDEEQNFFPELVQFYPLAQPIISELENQHIDLHENWRLLNQQLSAVLQGERDALDSLLIQQFTQGYAKHIPQEEQLFEWGKQHIPAENLRKIGQMMAARRQ